MRHPHGFTIIEMLVVVAIIATLAGMMTYNFAKPELRRQSVRLAAEELAATFRKARALAMERKSVHAVVFHVQNQPGSSGIVLNNRSGGHWYRILGPATTDVGDRTQTVDNLPPMAGAGYGFKPHNVFEIAEATNGAWADDPHVLTAGKVRFLALSDMDYGDTPNSFRAYRTTSAQTSYPRPWFGWYDAASKRLYPWGGYDPAIVGSGFYYWGTGKTRSGVTVATADPAPVGSVNPVARVLDHWSVGQSNQRYNNMPVPTSPATDVLYTAGSPRPLISADWRDCSIVFLSSGEVRWGYWMAARHGEYMTDGVTLVGAVPVKRGIYDRCNGSSTGYSGDVDQHIEAEVGNFDADSGGWYITLAPDVAKDTDQFPTAQAALDSISPMYRVFVSRLGEIKVIPVSRIDKSNGLTAFPPTASWWKTAANMQKFFPADRYVDWTVKGPYAQGLGAVQGKPITDFVTTGMLSERQVWMK